MSLSLPSFPSVPHPFPQSLSVQIVTPGPSSECPQKGDFVHVHYTGWLEDGTVFDSSLSRGDPFGLTLGAGWVISGWEQGLLQVPKGATAVLFIPSAWGYGANGAGNLIPPHANLIFQVTVLDQSSTT